MKIKHRISGLLCSLLLLSSSVLSAQNTNSLLWKISGNGLSKPSYLYGTVHLICPDDFVMGDAVKKAFSDAEQIVLELDMDDSQEMLALQTAMIDQEGVDYKGMMEDQDYQKLDSIIKAQLGVGMQLMSRSKPFAIMSMMYLTILDCGQPDSYELRFVQMAAEQEKELLGLETAAFQMSIFDKIPQKEQISWIADIINNPEDGKKDWGKMMTAYKAQDVEALYETMGDSPEYEQYEMELLENRNKDWIGKIGKLATGKPTFFAVGALHLGGDMGVINLLQQEGYTVKPVPNN